MRTLRGYFARKTSLEVREFTTCFDRLRQLDMDETRTIQSVIDVGNRLMISHKEIREKAGNRCAIALAIFITSEARLALLRMLERFPQEVIYYDTGETCFILFSLNFFPQKNCTPCPPCFR